MGTALDLRFEGWVDPTARSHFSIDAAEIRERRDGIRQLRQIRDYLQRYPEHLKRIGKIARPVNEYRRVQYLLVARDHWPWIEPENNLMIVECGGFVKAMLKAGSLSEALDGLLGYDWLPEEGRDFTVIFERSIVNGVAVDSEVFFPARPGQVSPAYGL